MSDLKVTSLWSMPRVVWRKFSKTPLARKPTIRMDALDELAVSQKSESTVSSKLTMTQKYQCCFCGDTILPVSPDVGGLLYTTCFDRGSGSQRDQQLYCHANCLADRLAPSVNLYVLDLCDKDPRSEP